MSSEIIFDSPNHKVLLAGSRRGQDRGRDGRSPGSNTPLPRSGSSGAPDRGEGEESGRVAEPDLAFLLRKLGNLLPTGPEERAKETGITSF